MKGSDYNLADLTKEEKAKIRQNENEFKNFSQQLYSLLSGRMKKSDTSKPLIVGKTPNSLVICNANKNNNIIITKKVIDKCIKPEMRNYDGKRLRGSGHGLNTEQLLLSIKSLTNPIMVLKGSVDNSLVAITELKDSQNREIIVPVSLNKQGFASEINEIVSVYGREEFSKYIKDQIEKGNVVSVHKEKAEEFLRRKGVDFPSPESFISYDDSIAYTLKNVKYPEKNLIEQANVSQKSEVISDLNFAEVFEPETSTNDAILHEKVEVFYDLSDMGTTANNIDYKKVFELYSESAKADDATALNNLGCCYINGEGTDRSIQKAIECFERAAALKNSLAVVNLGKCAAVGCGVAKDPERAFELYRQAANMGSPLAYRMLAECYLNGVGTNKDVSKAADCLRQAETVKNKPLSLEEKLLQAERKANAANENNKQQRKEKSQNVSKSI